MSSGERSESQSIHLCVEHAWLGLAVAALPVTLATFTIDHTTPADIHLAAYGILLALAVLGGCGWLVGSAERRLSGQIEQLRGMLDGIAAALPRPKPTARLDLSGASRGETVGIQQGVGLDPETIAAARSLARRIVDGPAGDTDKP